MLFKANSDGYHYVNYRNLNNPHENRNMLQKFNLQLNKDNDNGFANLAVNDNGKKYYTQYNDLQNFFKNLKENDNSIFQMAKNNNKPLFNPPKIYSKKIYPPKKYPSKKYPKKKYSKKKNSYKRHANKRHTNKRHANKRHTNKRRRF